MKNKETKNQKPSIAKILGCILLGLVLIGVVANIINSKEEPIEEDSTEEVLPENQTPGTDVEPGDTSAGNAGSSTEGEDPDNSVSTNTLTLVISGEGSWPDLTIEYEEGMTWGAWVESEYNTIGATIEMFDEQHFYIELGESYGSVSNVSTTSPDVYSIHLIDGSLSYKMI